MMTFEDFTKELFRQANEKGFNDYEVYYVTGHGFSVRVFKGEIAEYKNATTAGVGFRGTYNGKIGHAHTETLDLEIITLLLDNAIANSEIIEDEDVEKLYQSNESDEYQTVISYNPALNDIETSQKIQWAFDMEKYALSLDSRVKMADYCIIATTEGLISIVNSYGLNLSHQFNMATVNIVARVEENGCTKSVSEYWNGRDFADFDYKALAKKAVDTAISYLGAESIATGDYPVVLDRNIAKSIFGAFMEIFIGENAQKGFSLLNKDKIGTTIAAPHITLRDDGITDLSLGSMAFDAEGVATQKKAIIENGVLKTLLYNTKTAKKDGVKSTGNATKSGIGGAISTSHTNFYLVPSNTSFDELLAQVSETGVLITEVSGLHSGTNAVSGDFSVSAEGYLIEGGKIGRPIEQITIAGNFYEMLNNIVTVGSDLRFHSSGLGGIGMPSLLVNGLRVSGL